VLKDDVRLSELYRALARFAIRELPVSNREALEDAVG
jgi:hypothetical protein